MNKVGSNGGGGGGQSSPRNRKLGEGGGSLGSYTV